MGRKTAATRPLPGESDTVRDGMRLYWEVARRALQRQLAYRTENLAGAVTNIFFGYLRATVDKVVVVAVALASGTVIYFAIFVLGATFCFWTVQAKEATHVYT